MAEVTGHRRLYLEHNGERSRLESAWSWECSCGAMESGSTKAVALDEWRDHRQHVQAMGTSRACACNAGRPGECLVHNVVTTA